LVYYILNQKENYNPGRVPLLKISGLTGILQLKNCKQLKRFFRLSVPGNPLLRCPRVAEALAEAQALRKLCFARCSYAIAKAMPP